MRAAIESEAQRSTFLFWGALGLGGLALFSGFIGAFVFFILVVTGNIRPTMMVPSNRGRIYAETFAVWFVIFWFGQVGLSLVAEQIFNEVQAFAGTLVVFFGSLIALVWPVIRGIPFKTVRQDIGWKLKNPFVEIFYAVVSYVSMLPFLMGGLIMVAVLMFFIGIMQGAGVHPQGIIGIPLLTMLALGFCLVREWRDSLIAPMIMHAINNGCVAVLLFLIL